MDALAKRCQHALRHPDFRTFGEINIGLHKQYQSVIRNDPLRVASDRLFYQTARMWFRLLPRADWTEEIEDLRQEILAVKRFFAAGDIESAGFVHRNYLSLVFRRLERMC